jgi:hypothetical protein
MECGRPTIEDCAMPAEVTETARADYSICIRARAREKLRSEIPGHDPLRLREAIDGLQDTPRPPGCKTEPYDETTLYGYLVDTTKPPYLVWYLIDTERERIDVILIEEKRF